MLSRNSFLMLMTIGFVLSVFLTDVMGENLIKYDEDKDENVSYYDKDSIKQKSGITIVWTEDIFNEKTDKWIEWFKFCNKHTGYTIDDCNTLSYRKILYEINCKELTQRRLSSVIYDDKGKVLHTWSTPSEWNHIVPYSNMEELKNQVCK